MGSGTMIGGRKISLNWEQRWTIFDISSTLFLFVPLQN